MFSILSVFTCFAQVQVGLGNLMFQKHWFIQIQFKGFLNIKTTEELTSVTVYNVMGQEVLSTSHNLSQIDMSGLSNGAYLVKLNGATFTETLKIIKN